QLWSGGRGGWGRLSPAAGVRGRRSGGGRRAHACPAASWGGARHLARRQMTDAVSPELARRIGVMSADVPDAEPQTMLDWALHYAAREFFVFPAEPHLGRSYVKNWYNDATLDPKTIKEWFSKIDDDVDWYNADIGAVPDKS